MWGQPASALRREQLGRPMLKPRVSFHGLKIGGDRTAEGGRPHIIQAQIPCGAREVHDFHRLELASGRALHIDSHQCCGRKPAFGAASLGNQFEPCTKSGHRLVDGVHSIENTCTYKRVFFVD